jgi:DNA-binding NtrC family response regulator
MGFQILISLRASHDNAQLRAKPDQFDLVITHMTMPDINGDRLAAQMMAIRPEIPIIPCTGYSRTISDEKATEIGITAFAGKPLATADLAKTVRTILDKAPNPPLDG